jgi:hypothetical protein
VKFDVDLHLMTSNSCEFCENPCSERCALCNDYDFVHIFFYLEVIHTLLTYFKHSLLNSTCTGNFLIINPSASHEPMPCVRRHILFRLVADEIMMLYLTVNVDYPLRHDIIHEIITGLNTDFGEDFYSYLCQTVDRTSQR